MGRESRLQRAVDSKGSLRVVRRGEVSSVGWRETILISMKGSLTIINSSQGGVK